MTPDASLLATSAMKASQRERDAWKLALAKPDKIPVGYRTAVGWGKIWGKSASTARLIIRALSSKQMMSCKKFKITYGDSIPRPVTHYKLNP